MNEMNSLDEKVETLEQLIEKELKPYVKKIDAEGFYQEQYLRELGKAGFFSTNHKSQKEYILQEMKVVEETAKWCMTTAFCLWCHLAALTYVRNSNNLSLKNKLLPLLENGKILGATGLSNPMKYYAGLEKLHLKAKPKEDGYILSGVLPNVSNLGDNHWFGVIAEVDEHKRIMCFIPSNAEGLILKEKNDFLGLNGSATYSCTFQDVFVPNQWVLSDDADLFVEKIRPVFILYQIPLGLGVIRSSIASIEKVINKQNGCNSFLKIQPGQLKTQERKIQDDIHALFSGQRLDWKEIARIRLEAAYLTLEAVQANMLHHGSAGYLMHSAPSRRLREAYFFANLTPTVKHLEKVLHS